MTCTSSSFEAPSPSAAISRASSVHTASSASANLSASGDEASRVGAPERPFANRKHESLVLVSPSTVIMLKLRSTARLSAARANALSNCASVPMNASIVAMFGWIMPTPLVIAPMRTSRPPISSATAHSLGLVSVVMMARAASWPPSGRSSSALNPWRTRSIGMGTPMMPVEATMTRSETMPSLSAARRLISCASARPSWPLHALALPALNTTAWARPLDAPSSARLKITGAAGNLFGVKVAAATHSTSAVQIPRSGLPEALMPAASAPARKPRALVTEGSSST